MDGGCQPEDPDTHVIFNDRECQISVIAHRCTLWSCTAASESLQAAAVTTCRVALGRLKHWRRSLSPHPLSDALALLVRQRQVAGRLPSLVAMATCDDLVFTDRVHAASQSACDLDIQYRIGSITKTFTAALVLRLAEDGVLGLGDRVGEHLESTPFGEVTVRQLLSHSGGLQREAVGPMWQTFEGPTESELVASLPEAELIAAPGRRWHYSNLGYAVIGLLVREATGQSCEELINSTFVDPLGLARTSWAAVELAAKGYRVDPYQDVLHPEPAMDQRAAGAGGQMWSTATDLITWSKVLMGCRPDILSTDAVDEMHTLQAMVDTEDWRRGWGLGLALIRTGGRVWSGHTGAVPGFAAALLMDRLTESSVVLLTNTMDAKALDELALEIGEMILPARAPAESWRPSEACPPEIAPLLGSWWFEAGQVDFSWRGDRLEAELPGVLGSRSVFVREGADRFRVIEGREFGEVLIVHRDPGGEAEWIEWATYPYTRQPR